MLTNKISKERFLEIFRYGLTGLSNTLVNIFIYHFLLLIGVDYNLSNFIAILICKIYGYVVNKLFVFRSRCSTRKELLSEIVKYILSRGFSCLIDYFGLLFAVEILHGDKIISKYVIQIIIIVMNYLTGKFMVFKNIDTGKTKNEL